MNIDKNRAGLTLASVSGLLHLVWVLIYSSGLGKMIDEMHSSELMGGGHDIGGIGFAILCIIGSIIAGYIVGWLIAYFWNFFGKKEQE